MTPTPLPSNPKGHPEGIWMVLREVVGGGKAPPDLPSFLDMSMALSSDLEQMSITLPLDTVLEVIKATRGGSLSDGTSALLKIEVAYVLATIGGLEEEVMEAVLKDTFGSA